MKKTLIVLLIAISHNSVSQTIVEIDSIAKGMCAYLKTIEIKNDTLKIQTLYQEQLYPYLMTIEESKAQMVGERTYYRLQRNCVGFRELLDRLDPPKEAVIRTTEKPKPQISNKELREFKKRKDFYYFEASGDTTKVQVGNGNWTDSFADKTLSKLTYNWIDKVEFELVFIESNNESRANLSVKGDRFIYQVLEKKDGYYLMALNIPGQKTFEKFKLYYE